MELHHTKSSPLLPDVHDVRDPAYNGCMHIALRMKMDTKVILIPPKW
jgi:hypothetical protein